MHRLTAQRVELVQQRHPLSLVRHAYRLDLRLRDVHRRAHLRETAPRATGGPSRARTPPPLCAVSRSPPLQASILNQEALAYSLNDNCESPPPPPKPTGGGPQARRGVLSCIKRLFVLEPPTPIPDTLFSPAQPNYNSVEDYIAQVGSAPPLARRAPNVALESVVLYHKTHRAGAALLVLHFRHLDFPHATTSISLERLPEDDFTTDIGCPVPDDMLMSSTTSSDADMLMGPHVACRSLTFPNQDCDRAPTILDVLALAQLERDKLTGAEKPNGCSVAYAQTIYTALATLFHGGSEEGPGGDPAPTAHTSEVDSAEIQAVVAAFPNALTSLKIKLALITVRCIGNLPENQAPPMYTKGSCLWYKTQRQEAEIATLRATIERNDPELAALRAEVDALREAAAIEKQAADRRRITGKAVEIDVLACLVQVDANDAEMQSAVLGPAARVGCVDVVSR
ncbi:hypothetical protein DFH09DRAFT_1479867 [Mycena vulgaris]|nr:hypothetical protein DFH09DRAFT_1479867 [Mycena vulgaris]